MTEGVQAVLVPSSEPEPATVEPEEETEEEADDEEDSEQSDASSTEGSEGTGIKKRKKKKKKKKKKPEDGEQQVASPPLAVTTKAQKQEHERRFVVALEAARTKNEMWIQLKQCSLPAAKAQKLMEALTGNSTITSLSLTQTEISDEALQVISASLTSGAAPELISLDLRGIEITPTGTQVLALLQKQRKELKVETGSLSPPPSPSSPDKLKEDRPRSRQQLQQLKQQQQQQELEQQQQQGGQQGGQQGEHFGPMFRQFFQMGNGGDEDEEEGEGEAEGATQPLTPEQEQEAVDQDELAEGLFAQLADHLEVDPSDTPPMSTLLCIIGMWVGQELDALQASATPPITREQLRPHMSHSLANLSLLGTLLDLTPPPVTTQFSSEPQPAVGSHRVWAAELVALLLSVPSSEVEQLLAASGLPAKVVGLALQHPYNSPLQSRALRVIAACSESTNGALWGGLLRTDDAVSARGGGEGAAGGAEGEALLHERLVAALQGQEQLRPGQRSTMTGFAVEAGKSLLVARGDVAQLLKGHVEWEAFVAEGTGVLWQLASEQEGELVGPKPSRRDMYAGAGDESSELLAMMQGVGLG